MVRGRQDEEAGHPALGVQFKGEGDTGKGPRKRGDAAMHVGVGDWRDWGGRSGDRQETWTASGRHLFCPRLEVRMVEEGES